MKNKTVSNLLTKIEEKLHDGAPHEPSASTARALVNLIKLQQASIEQLQNEIDSMEK